MSLVKHLEIQCDRCRGRLSWSQEIVANITGKAKGGGSREIRAEAKAQGWIQSRTRSGKPVDLCEDCKDCAPLASAWFED